MSPCQAQDSQVEHDVGSPLRPMHCNSTSFIRLFGSPLMRPCLSHFSQSVFPSLLSFPDEEEQNRHILCRLIPIYLMSISQYSVVIAVFFISLFSLPALPVNALGSSSTIAASYATGTVCGILAGHTSQAIQCYRQGHTINLQPQVSYEAISGGRSFFCGLRSGGSSLLCWDTTFTDASFRPKRIYYSDKVGLTDLTVGDAQVCALEAGSGGVKCWRGGGRDGSLFPTPEVGSEFQKITSGRGFTCGILKDNSRVLCWGVSAAGAEIQRQFGGLSMSSLVAGDSHACGLTDTGILVCKGNNDTGQLGFPSVSAFEFSGLALGANHTCAIQRRNGTVKCWGGGTNGSEFVSQEIKNVSFESVIAGSDFTCGLTSRNLSVICWGPGWTGKLHPGTIFPLEMIIPGPCVETSCSICGTYPNSEVLCDGFGNICKSCEFELPIPLPLPLPILPPQPSEDLSPNSPASPPRNRLLLAFLIVGSIGLLAGICSIMYCLWAGVCSFIHKQIYDSAQPNVNGSNADNSNAQTSKSPSIKRQSSFPLRRQRSGPSSRPVGDRAESFSLSELAAATNMFSLENKIGGGSFGTVYRGKLADGREVAIKRGETGSRIKKFQEKEIAFDSELALLSRLHHKHLVELVGFCEENDEKLLVYEYMSNESLHDHLHNKNGIEESSNILNSWKMRIKIALDAARGIEYLHNYAVPPIIHRDIKSSNILLDGNWTAKVSDFGLSLMGPNSNQEHLSTRAVGTVGYIDPEYYVLNVLTAKSDVYGLGVVLLELLTGKRAVFKEEVEGALPIGIVDYAVPQITAGELWRILDIRVGPPEGNEAEPVELMANIAIHCAKLEGKERPTMTDIVPNLERALALCEGSQASISSTSFSIISE